MKWIIYELRIWNQVKLWSSQLWTQFLQLRKEAWKIQDFNGVWTRDLAIPVRRSNQLSYEATDVGSWSFVGSNVHIWSISYIISSLIHSSREHRNLQKHAWKRTGDDPVNQSKPEVITRSRHKALENVHARATIGFGFTSEWLEKMAREL